MGLTNELRLINDADVWLFTTFMVNNLPDYFWRVQGSTSGKYHPKSDAVEGGLVIHTRNVVKIATELFTIYNFTQYERDIIIASLILHDGYKCGTQEEYLENGGFSVHAHPLIIKHFIMHPEEHGSEGNLYNAPEYNSLKMEISNCVSKHMGKWTTSSRSCDVLPLPISTMECFVHQCDYIASRACINIDLE